MVHSHDCMELAQKEIAVLPSSCVSQGLAYLITSVKDTMGELVTDLR